MPRTSSDPSPESTRALPSKAGKPGRRPLEALLSVSGAPATPPAFQLSRGRCLIGSGVGCDIVVSDPTVSRQHVEFVPVPEGVAVRDLGSTNGTLYLGHRVREMVLSFGGRVSIGDATVAIELDPSALPDDL